MNLLIIGNGFDLAHGLPTRYIDFLDFMNKIKLNSNYKSALKKFNEYKNNILPDNMIDDYTSNAREELMKNYDFLKTQSNNNIWISYFIKTINKDTKNKGWIDFETEISKVIQSFEYVFFIEKYKREKGYKIDNCQLSDVFFDNERKLINTFKETTAKNFWNNINQAKGVNGFYSKLYSNEDFYKNHKGYIDKLIDDLKNLTRCLEIYLHDIIGNITIEASDTIKHMNIDHVLSFNYTNTFEKIYDDGIRNIEYCYIHGKANMENTDNMVLGIDDYLEGSDIDKKTDFIEFKKYYQRIFNNNSVDYQYWIEESNKSKAYIVPDVCSNIYVYGHSLDVTDKDILEPILMMEKVKINIYYYDDKDHRDKIANLVKIIGRDNLIKKTSSVEPSITFKEITQ